MWIISNHDSIRSVISDLTINAQWNEDLHIGYLAMNYLRNWYIFNTEFEIKKLGVVKYTGKHLWNHLYDWQWMGFKRNYVRWKHFSLISIIHKTTYEGKTCDLKFKTKRQFNESQISIFSESLNTGYTLGTYNLILITKDLGDCWYFKKDCLAFLGPTISITGASMPSNNVLFYSTNFRGRIV